MLIFLTVQDQQRQEKRMFGFKGVHLKIIYFIGFHGFSKVVVIPILLFSQMLFVSGHLICVTEFEMYHSSM